MNDRNQSGFTPEINKAELSTSNHFLQKTRLTFPQCHNKNTLVDSTKHFHLLKKEAMLRCLLSLLIKGSFGFNSATVLISISKMPVLCAKLWPWIVLIFKQLCSLQIHWHKKCHGDELVCPELWNHENLMVALLLPWILFPLLLLHSCLTCLKHPII